MFQTTANRTSFQEQGTPASLDRGNILGPLAGAFLTALLCAVPLVLILFRGRMQPWVFMWALAASIFANCKSHSWFAARDLVRRANWRRNVAYLLLWPGMNSSQFLDSTIIVQRPAASEWLSTSAITLSGASLIWLAVRHVPQPLLAVWIGMLGLILILHFGVFHLLSLAWRAAGICAPPIMQHPLRSQSLSEFWGKRWNLGFRQLSHDWVFKPLRKDFGAGAAMLGAFLASGLIHDLVISVPARAGYGLPTAYFVLQGCGVLAERSAIGIRFGMGRGITGWLWMALLTAGPAYWLFHPAFALRVMGPFLRAIGAGC
jgi:hypothetical protein